MTADERTRRLRTQLNALLHEPANAGQRGIRVVPASHWRGRLCGLLGRRGLHRRVGVWLRPCNAVHTFGMHFTLTVVFLDRSDQCLKIVWRMPPNHVAVCKRAASVVEFSYHPRAGVTP